MSQEESLQISLIDSLKSLGIYNQNRHDKFFLGRFLRARKCNIQETSKMIANYEEWYAQEHIDSILSDFSYPALPQVRKFYPR